MPVVPPMIIVINPVAGRRRAHLLWRVLDVLVANGVRLDLAETHRAGHAEALAREAVQRGEKMVVAAGGDGTIGEVASGLMGSGTRLGVIPLGTANVFANELGLPFAPRAVAAALAFGRTGRLWPGLASGEDGARLFVQMLEREKRIRMFETKYETWDVEPIDDTDWAATEMLRRLEGTR